MSEKKIAEVPYDAGLSYDFYEDRLIVEDKTILYKDIQGFGYLLTHKTNSIYFIPVSNSTSYRVYLDLTDEVFQFGKSGSSAMFFKTEKQRKIDLIYSEVYKCINTFVAPLVFEKCFNHLDHSKKLEIGGLTITPTELTKKAFRGTKSLPLAEYKSTSIYQGNVRVYDNAGKIFFGCPLSTINAPLIGGILDSLTGK